MDSLVCDIHSLPGDGASITGVEASRSNVFAGCVGDGRSLRDFRHQSVDRDVFIDTFRSGRLNIRQGIRS